MKRFPWRRIYSWNLQWNYGFKVWVAVDTASEWTDKTFLITSIIEFYVYRPFYGHMPKVWIHINF